MLQKWLGLIGNIDFKTLKITILLYLKELRNFHFSLFNPLFWVFLLILFLILSRAWGYRKSFSYCSILAIVLLVTTMLENSLASTLAKSEVFDATVLKIISIFVISMVTLYYFFIRSD